MRRSRMLALIAGATLPLAACGTGADGNQTAAAATTAATTETTGVVREEAAPPPPPVQPMAQESAIQSQPGPDGSQVDLIKLAVTGDILTATFRCSSADAINTEAFALKNISMIDDATSQRISVLKDNAGNWLASNPAGDSIMASCEAKPGIFWIKFPAPPVTSATVSLTLPKTAPFDGVPVTR